MSQGTVSIAVHTRTGVHRWLAAAESLPFDHSPGSPWLFVPHAVRAAFDVVVGSGTPLADSAFGPPLLGVKCGCNEAFVVARETSKPGVGSRLVAGASECAHPLVPVYASPGAGADRSVRPRSGHVEREVLRPIVRGETLGRWVSTARAWDGRSPAIGGNRRTRRGPEWIIWTHGDPRSGAGGPLPALPPHAAQWLAYWRHRLAARSDTRGQAPWWALFRTDSAASVHPRVVWSDLGRAPRAAVLAAGDPTVPLNSCYVARAADLADAQALTALLNSAIAAAWLNIIAEPARGGYRRYLGWTVGLLPLPTDWTRTRQLLAPIAASAANGVPPSEAVLTQTVADAYGVDLDALRPLLAWSGA